MFSCEFCAISKKTSMRRKVLDGCFLTQLTHCCYSPELRIKFRWSSFDDNSKHKHTIKQQNLLVHINTLTCPIVLAHSFWTYILSFHITQNITSGFYSVCSENWLWFLHYIDHVNTVSTDFIITVLLAQLLLLKMLCFLEPLDLL